MSALLFVYGTLKRGCSNHRQLAGGTFIGAARTRPGYTLYDVGGYPGLVKKSGHRPGVSGEVWSVNKRHVAKLDHFEGLPEGPYRREPVPLRAPFAGQKIEAYVYAAPIDGLPPVGSEWIEP